MNVADATASTTTASTATASTAAESTTTATAATASTADPVACDPVAYSIVTAVRDRPGQLRLTTAAISRHGHHAEHLIIDWSSQPPIRRQDLPADPRLRLVRVEGERQWWLSRAYNRGFQLARHGWILKADADALLEEAFFRRFAPAAATLQLRHLVGGVAAAGGLDDLGLFAVERAALLAVGGFNPYLFGWGYDDLDLFERLFLHPGTTLAHLPAAGVTSLPHGIAERLGAAEPDPDERGWRRGLLIQRQQAQLEANRCMAALTRALPLAPDAPADCLERLPAVLLRQRRRALLRGWLRPLLGRHGGRLAAVLPAAWLPAVLRGLGISDLPRLPAAPPPGESAAATAAAAP